MPVNLNFLSVIVEVIDKILFVELLNDGLKIFFDVVPDIIDFLKIFP